jgi:RNA methyltransferase, TrmH family
MEISSTSNPRIKDILKLSKTSERKNRGVFVVEGYREISRAVDSGFIMDSLFYCPILNSSLHVSFVNRLAINEKISITREVFEKITYRDNVDGLVAIFQSRHELLKDLPEKENALYLVVETVEKPGNLGAILRTADAAGVDAVIVCDNQTDIYNPNVIRSSIGCLFTNHVIQAESIETIQFLAGRGVKIYAAALQKSKDYYSVNFKGSTAVVLGSEAHGLSDIWRESADAIIRIPMQGEADSLNVSVSAAILLFEAVRQRKTI